MKAYPIKVDYDGDLCPKPEMLRPQVQARARLMMPHLGVQGVTPTYCIRQTEGDFERNELTAYVDFNGEMKGDPLFDSAHEILG